MPAHLVDAAGLESDRERPIVVRRGRLVRVEQGARGVSCGAGGETEDHLDGLLLEGAERTLRVPLQIEVLVGDSHDNAMAESIIGLYKVEVIRPRGPWRVLEAVELATLEWVDWFNNRRILESIGD